MKLLDSLYLSTGTSIDWGSGAATLSNSGSTLTVKGTDTATSDVSTILVVGHNTSGTPSVGYGTATVWQLQDSTTANVDAAKLVVSWSVATHDSQKASVVFYVYDTVARMVLTAQASGSAPMIGFLGAQAAVRQTGDVGTALVTNGLMSGTPTFSGANVTGIGGLNVLRYERFY